MNQKNILVRANLEFIDKNFEAAAVLYKEAFEKASEPLKSFIKFNLKLALRRLGAEDSIVDLVKPEGMEPYCFNLIKQSGLFDPVWYVSQYQKKHNIKTNPLVHYLDKGVELSTNPSPWFNTEYYLNENPDIANGTIHPFLHYIEHGRKENRDPRPLLKLSELELYKPVQSEHVPRLDILTPAPNTKVRVIAFYLPQFHTIPENDAWWGKGFTEWTNVRSAKPQFYGHYQPHVPDSYLGYYDLRDTGIMRKQIDLAKQYGIEGFCFYTYWFSGHRLLETPVDNYLKDKTLDLPFCICWANENWSRRWDGDSQNILIAQNYSDTDDLAFISHMSKYLRDSRYIRIEGKPLIIVYRPNLFPSMKKTAARWRSWCRKNGLGDIFIAYVQSFETTDPIEYELDAAIEFPPSEWYVKRAAATDITLTSYDCETNVYDWRMMYGRSLDYQKVPYKLFRGVNPSWDNTARRKKGGTVFHNCSPKLFERWLINGMKETLERIEVLDEQIVFVNAWNEWAEGAHLEPDEKFGYAWLQAIRNAHEHFCKEQQYTHNVESLFATTRVKDNKPHYPSPGIYFDTEFYIKNYPEVLKSDLNPYDYYIERGWNKNHNPSNYFSTSSYLLNYQDVKESGINPLIHYLLYGASEGRISLSTEGYQLDDSDLKSIADDFDSDYYESQLDGSRDLKLGLLEHYLKIGWKLGCDPSKNFCTKYYLDSNKDISDSGVNPYVHYLKHGKGERREGIPYYQKPSKYNPRVSVIVPNYNHEIYLRQRIESITKQTYKNIEIIFLDDCSTDRSFEVSEDALQASGIPFKIYKNENNSGGVFFQWEKGIKLANGELIWICESDDYCEIDFLERLVPYFKQQSVQMTFGNIQFCDSDGNVFDGMDGFRNNAEEGIWSGIIERPAYEWFSGAFGVRNIVSNVGGCVFRKVDLPIAVWNRAKSLKIVGDWYLYINILGGGKLIFDPAAKAYFRQHKNNTSSGNFNKKYFYEECLFVLTEIIGTWGVSEKTIEKFWKNVRNEYVHFGLDDEEGAFEESFPLSNYLNLKRTKPHILIAMLGFTAGGGELLPIHLANALSERGYIVSIYAFHMDEINMDMRQKLNLNIPVYNKSDVNLLGADNFINKAGVSIVHSHVISCEVSLLLSKNPIVSVPYIVSLHGSYDDPSLDHNFLPKSVLPYVTKWVYTADKNLNKFKLLNHDLSEMVKIENGMPYDSRPFELSRRDLFIADDSVVFTFVARGVKQKGWRVIIDAFNMLVTENKGLDVTLILVGDGYYTDEEIGKIVLKNNKIKFLGYQSRINGIYRISNCAVIPTRFDGESAPLCLIQAIQENLPIIATDIGDIKSMLSANDGLAGLMLQKTWDNQKFGFDLKNSMLLMCDPNVRKEMKIRVASLQNRFSFERMTDSYVSVYNSCMKDTYV